MQGFDSNKIALAQMKEVFAKNLHQKLASRFATKCNTLKKPRLELRVVGCRLKLNCVSSQRGTA